MNPGRYPRTAAYLRSLPQGLASYPECIVKGDVFSAARELVAEGLRGDAEDLPEPLRAYVQGHWREQWFSDVAGTCMNLLARDLVFPGDEQLLKFAYEASAKVFERPLYRVIMKVLSPTLVIVNAAKRWTTFRKGTTLTRNIFERDAKTARACLALTYPSGLYPKLMLLTFAESYRAAADAAHAPEAKVTLAAHDECKAEFEVSWTP